MINALFALLFLFALHAVNCQPPGPPPGPAPGPSTAAPTSSSLCAVDGSDWYYSEVISGTDRSITVSMCPNHYSGCQKQHCDGTKGEAISSTTVWSLPAYPVLGTSDYWFNVTCYGGTVAVALNGANIYSQYDATASCGDAVQAEGNTFDACGGHADFSKRYHYHIPPTCLIDQLGNMSDGHSPQIGWAIDGFPIYGPNGLNGASMYPCTHASANASYCLDSCNGYEGYLPSIDEFYYRYYSTGPLGDRSCSSTVTNSDTGTCDGQGGCCINILPDTSYNPYTIGCLKGCRNNNPGCINTGKVAYTYATATTATPPDSVYQIDWAPAVGLTPSPTPAPTLPTITGTSESILDLNVSYLNYDLIESIYCNATLTLLEKITDGEWACTSSSITILESTMFSLRRMLNSLTTNAGLNKVAKQSSKQSNKHHILSSASYMSISIEVGVIGHGAVAPDTVLTNTTLMTQALKTEFENNGMGSSFLSVSNTQWIDSSSGGSDDDDSSSNMGLGVLNSPEGLAVVSGLAFVVVAVLGTIYYRRTLPSYNTMEASVNGLLFLDNKSPKKF